MLLSERLKRNRREVRDWRGTTEQVILYRKENINYKSLTAG